MSQPNRLNRTPKGFILPNIPGTPAVIAKVDLVARKDSLSLTSCQTKPSKHPLLDDEQRVFPRDSIDDLFDFSAENDEEAETS